MRYEYETQQLELPYSSTLQAMADGRIEPVFDFLIRRMATMRSTC